MIPLFSPVRQNEPYYPKFQQQYQAILGSGHYILGPEVAQFETALSQMLGYQTAIGCSSGTEALILAIKSLNLPPNAQIITPAFSFVASASSIVWAGYRPVFADVKESTQCVSVETLKKALTPETKAVVVVDLYGRQDSLKEIRDFCNEHHLYLVEDGAQSIGVPNKGADLYCTSFYPTKILGAIGDAGAILTDNEELATQIHPLLQHGSRIRDDYAKIGTNARMDTIHAANLNIKLNDLPQWLEKRRALALLYNAALKPLEEKGRVKLPPIPADPKEHVWALYTLLVPGKRNELVQYLNENGVGSGVYYSKTLNQQKALAAYSTPCPTAEKLAGEVLSIPLFPELSPSEVDKILSTLNQWPL